MYKGFISVEAGEAMSVAGGTEMEDAARALGRMIGRLVGTIEKLFSNSETQQASASC